MPVLFTLKAQLGRHCSKLWRMDSSILNDEVSVSEMRMNIYASLEDTPQITPTAWDLLKARWRLIAQEAGKMRHARLTSRMNETLRRIQIVERAGNLTGAIQEYFGAKKAKNDLLLRARSGAFKRAEELHLPTDELGNLAYAQRVGVRKH